MQTSGVRAFQKWRWAGDQIVDSTIPASRTLPGSKIPKYPIDIREFLSIEHNVVVRDFLHRTVIDSLVSPEARERFWRNAPGNFDFRVQTILKAFGTFTYLKGNRRFDAWMFPEETLAVGGGDCEDLAFLLAALIEEAGISADCLRVALGTLVDHGQPRSKAHDHAWVVYQSEHGVWRLLDPVSMVSEPRARKAPVAPVHSGAIPDIEYIPAFVFNRDHLWRIRSPQNAARNSSLSKFLRSRSFWDHFSPAFAKAVHETIYAQAGISGEDLAVINRQSLWVDVNVLGYDPRDHFDFSYIEEGWLRVQSRLDTGKLEDFALAAHAIADFYAHSLYGHVVSADPLPVYDPQQPPGVGSKLDFLFEEPKFAAPGSPPHDQAWAKKYWSGKLISGQWWRWFTTYPGELKGASQLPPRRCLPDHDQLAVDQSEGGGGNHLYDPTAFKAQFGRRQKAAVAHIAREWKHWVARFRP